MLEKNIASKQDSLDMYKKLPFFYAKNPLNKKDSLLIKNPKSWITFDSSIRKIEQYSEDLLTQELSKTNHYVEDELNMQKEIDIIQTFKRNNQAFCKRWAYALLDYEIGAVNTSNEDYESNPAYQNMISKLMSLSANDSVFNKNWDKVENLKKADFKSAWEMLKKSN
jgi:hypothetical protein